LAAKRGHNVLAEEWRDNWLGVALALVRGQMPDEDLRLFKENAPLWAFVSELADRIKTIGPEKSVSEKSTGSGRAAAEEPL